MLLALPALTLANNVLLFLAAAVAVALIGGVWPALMAAVAGSLALTYFHTAGRPVHDRVR